MPQRAFLDDRGLTREPALLDLLDARLHLRPVLLQNLQLHSLLGFLGELLPHVAEIGGKLAPFGGGFLLFCPE